MKSLRTLSGLALINLCLLAPYALAQDSVSTVSVSVVNGSFRVSGTVASETERETVFGLVKAILGQTAALEVKVGRNIGSFERNWKETLAKQLETIAGWKSGLFVFKSSRKPDELSSTILDSEFQMLSGSTRTLRASADRMVVLVFFATWCEPCRQQIAWLDDLLKSRLEPRVELIALDVDGGSPRDLGRFARQFTSFKFGWTTDDMVTEAIALAKIGGIPITLVTRDGKLLMLMRGAGFGMRPEFESFLEKEFPRK